MNSKISALFFCMMASFAAQAATPKLTVKAATKSSVFNLEYAASESGSVRVSILDKNNQAVFTEVLSNVGSFVRPYNFSELSEGEYTIVVDGKNGKQAEKINYTVNKVTSYVHVTEVASQPNKYLLRVANNGAEQVMVRIFGQDASLLHQQKVQVDGGFSLIYNLNKVNNKGVTFEVETASGNVHTINF